MENSPLRLLLLDMDGTLTSVTSPWQYVHQKLGLWDRHGKALLEAFLQKEIGFVEFCEQDAQLWTDRRIPLSEVEAILDTIPVPQEAVDFLRSAHEAGLRLAIVSAGFTRTADRIRSLAGLAQDDLFVVANDLKSGPDGSILPVLRVGDGTEIPGKAFWASHVMHQNQLTREQVGAIGDTSSDRPLYSAAGVWSQIGGPKDLATIPWLAFLSCAPTAVSVPSEADSSAPE